MVNEREVDPLAGYLLWWRGIRLSNVVQINIHGPIVVGVSSTIQASKKARVSWDFCGTAAPEKRPLWTVNDSNSNDGQLPVIFEEVTSALLRSENKRCHSPSGLKKYGSCFQR